MRLILVDKKELQMGIDKESREHGMSYEEARRTAIDHLKERPDYYSVAEKAGLEEEGLEEWTDSIFTKEKTIRKEKTECKAGLKRRNADFFPRNFLDNKKRKNRLFEQVP